MNRHLVVAIDANLSPATELGLHVASSLLARSPPPGFVLLHVIPVSEIPQSRFGTSRFTTTAEQREVAEQALHRARIELQKQSIVPEQAVSPGSHPRLSPVLSHGRRQCLAA
jgi:hypothetical protein